MNGHSDYPLEATGPDEGRRDLFRRTTLEPRPIDVERLLSKLGQPHSPAPRRRWFAIAVAAAALLVAAGGVGWSAGSVEARRESLKVEAALRGELDTLRKELASEFSRALAATEEDILSSRAVGMKRLALLLRRGWRREARMRSASAPVSMVARYQYRLEGK